MMIAYLRLCEVTSLPWARLQVPKRSVGHLELNSCGIMAVTEALEQDHRVWIVAEARRVQPRSFLRQMRPWALTQKLYRAGK